LGRRAELGEFLRVRRARLTPQDVGLPECGRHRRVPGLRREELAQLAGVSVAYYTRLEQGGGRRVSADILDSLARALQLPAAEYAHLMRLGNPEPRRREAAAPVRQVRPALLHLLHAIDSVPVYVLGQRTDILAWNRMAAAVFGDWAQLPAAERNWARLVFLKPEYRELYADWEVRASEVVGCLRRNASRHPDDPQLSALVGEVSVRSVEFRRLWAAGDTRRQSRGAERIRHPVVGELTLRAETFGVPDGSQQVLITHHAKPGTASAEALQRLASRGPDVPCG
jgi:transcriptional regulator with XRE-family HTH domain